MSTQEILAQLPGLSAEERSQLAEALQALAANDPSVATSSETSIIPRAGLHEGAWEVADDFDDPLPDEFWLGGKP